jgi:hypothetical protein
MIFFNSYIYFIKNHYVRNNLSGTNAKLITGAFLTNFNALIRYSFDNSMLS